MTFGQSETTAEIIGEDGKMIDRGKAKTMHLEVAQATLILVLLLTLA